MIIKAIYIGNTEEAFICKNFESGFNIIYSDDNNKGKTIVIQSILYCFGNIPVFPTSFDYKDYYYLLCLDYNGQLFKICRKDKNIVVSNGIEILVFDNISEFKRYWNKEISELPMIRKANLMKITDPELFVQMFFVGQDKKLTYDIVNKGYYKKEDFYNMIYALNGIYEKGYSQLEVEKVKIEIDSLKSEKQQLIKENKILKKKSRAEEILGATNDRLALEDILREADTIKDIIIELKKERNRAIARKKKNEAVLKELRSLNRNMRSGEIICMDCGSNHVSYESADAEFSFDISTSEIRSQILKAIEEKVYIYSEEIDKLTNEINLRQDEFDKCLETDDNVTLDLLLVVKKEMDNSKDADKRISEIEKQLQQLEGKLDIKVAVSEDIDKKQKFLLNSIVDKMNEFYHKLNKSNDVKYSDIFTKKDKVYSGSEGIEFYLAKIYALQQVLQHNYPIIIDSFRAEDLSTDREERVIKEFKKVKNQLIFTTTLKNEESGKYANSNVHCIDFSRNMTNHILSKQYVDEFITELRGLSLKI